MAVRKPDKLYREHVKMANLVVIKNYFDALEKTLKENNLMDKPDNIFNLDESSLNLELRKGKVISRSSKYTYCQAKGGRDHLTVSAAG